ncbi:MAG TPA: DHHA1 domain-containing protein [Pirellulales bacterium]
MRDLKKHSSPKGTGELSADKLLAEATDLGGVHVVVAETPGADAGMMRQLIDQLRRKASPIAVLLGSREAEKVTLVAGISRDLEERGLDAGQWIRGAAEAVGGRGGGKADMAQAGGKRPEKLPEALQIARDSVASLLAS